MIFNTQRRGSKKGARGGSKAAPAARLHSIAALLTERQFTGSFDVAGSTYKFIYAPGRAEIADGRLHMLGRFAVTGPRGNTRTLEEVRARLASTQGGLGTSPARRQILASMVQTETDATAEQQQQIAGETDRPGEKQPDKPARVAKAKRPDIESTGRLSFTGVLYFHLDPLDGRALGVPADLGRVQLNARLAPVDETAMRLQAVYSSIVDALYEKGVDKRVTGELLEELNNLLRPA
jgi:hypothetical protein